MTPEGFKDLDGTMLNKVCSQCGNAYNIDEATYRRRSGREPDLCQTHRVMYLNFRERSHTVTCEICGTSFQCKVSEWLERSRNGKPMLCPNCTEATAACDRCGQTYSIRRDRLEALAAKNSRLLCPDCLERELPLTTCEGENCGRSFRIPRERLERLQHYNDPVLCLKCLRRRSAD